MARGARCGTRSNGGLAFSPSSPTTVGVLSENGENDHDDVDEMQMQRLMRAGALQRKAAGSALEACPLSDSLLRHICELQHGRNGSNTTGGVLSPRWWLAHGAIIVLTNVTLGAGRFELDKVVVAVPQAAAPAKDRPLRTSTEEVSSGSRRRTHNSHTSRTSSESSSSSSRDGPVEGEPVLVLGIVEEKSNPNDIGASFTHFQVRTSLLTKGTVCVLRVRVDIIGHVRIRYVGKSQSCMVQNGRLILHAS